MLRGWPAPRPGGGERSRPLPPLGLGGARATDRPPRGGPPELRPPRGSQGGGREGGKTWGGLFLLKAAPPESVGEGSLSYRGWGGRVLVYRGEGNQLWD